MVVEVSQLIGDPGDLVWPWLHVAGSCPVVVVCCDLIKSANCLIGSH